MTVPGASDGAPRWARWFVGVTFALLLVPGLIGADAWPLTAWRLFSLARDDEQTVWTLHAVTAPEGTAREVSLEELPLEYRHAAWPMAELPRRSRQRRDDVCQALLEAVVAVEPSLTSLDIVRDRQRLVERDGGWLVDHDPEVVHTCEPEAR